MIFRIFIILLLVIFHKEIFSFLSKFKLDSFENTHKTLKKKTKSIINKIVNKDVNDSLLIIKNIDKQSYKKCLKIIKNIYRIKDDILNDRHINLRNEIDNMKLQKKEILNVVAGIVVSKGLFSSQDKILKNINNFIIDIMNEILDISNKKKYDINWFEYDVDEIEPNDTNSHNFSFNYNLF